MKKQKRRLRSLISQKNYFGVEDLVKEQGLNAQLSGGISGIAPSVWQS